MGKATSTLRAELAAHDEAIERDREHVRQHQVSIAEAQAAKSAASADPERYDELLAQIGRDEREVERLGLVIERRQKDREACAQALAEHEFEDAHEAWAKACTAAKRHSETMRARLGEAAKAAAQLARTRTAADVAKARAQELNPHPRYGLDWPADVDEPDWPDVGQLLELAAAGPRQPKRKGEEAKARGDAERAAGDELRIGETVRQALAMPDIEGSHDQIFGGLEEPLRSEARRRYEAELARELERRAAVAAAAN